MKVDSSMITKKQLFKWNGSTTGLGIVILNFKSLIIYRLFWLKTKELVDWRFRSSYIC